MLRYKGANTAPVLLHDRTAAIIDSDFTFVLRMNIHGLVIDTLCSRADQYEGQSTLDGLQMTSMKSAMDEDMVALTKRGYISKSNITISATQVQQNMGLVLRQDIPGLFFLWRSKRLARGRRLRPEPGPVVEANANRQPGDRPLPSPFRPAFDGDWFLQ